MRLLDASLSYVCVGRHADGTVVALLVGAVVMVIVMAVVIVVVIVLVGGVGIV